MAVKQKIPKWMELEDGEAYLWSQMSWKYLLGLYLLMVIWISISLYLAIVMDQLVNVGWSLIFVLFSIPLFAESLWANRLHLTNQRLVMEIGNKNAGEIRLDEIKTIQVKKYVIGGNVVILSTIKDKKPLAITAIKPYQFAEEIQQLSAGTDDETNTVNNHKGVAK